MKRVTTLLVLVATMMICFKSYSQITATYNEVLSKQKKGQIDKYITQNGEECSVGDSITIGVPFRNDQFDFILQNGLTGVYPLSSIASNSRVVINKITIRSKTVIVRTTKPQGSIYGLSIINFDSAIANGEVKSKIMTSDEALSELKKWKDKFDLELISKEVYEKKKQELSKYIK